MRDKKELKERRNIQTAKLSRDRKKLEVEFMREVGIAYLTCLNKVRNYLGKISKSSRGPQKAFAKETLSKINGFSKDLPQNFEFFSDSTQDCSDTESANLSGNDSTLANGLHV